MLRTILTAVILLLFINANGQLECPSKKDTITPGMLEMMFPINQNLVSFKTYYVDKDYKLTSNSDKFRYKFMVPEYNGDGASYFKTKLGKALDHCPLISEIEDSLLHGELIYRSKGSFLHLSFNKGVLWSISEEGKRYEEWRSYTDLSLLFGDNPKWIRKEHYNLDGDIESISYWYSCGEDIKMDSWEYY